LKPLPTSPLKEEEEEEGDVVADGGGVRREGVQARCILLLLPRLFRPR
jgi:hypothetical protein